MILGRVLNFAFATSTVCLLAFSCTKSKPSNSETSSESSLSAVDPELGTSDLSILVPLQSSIEDNLAASQFGKSGTGMCNAPTLDLGGADPILSEELWQDWAKDTLLSILPLPSDSKVWNTRPGQVSLAERRTALLEAMRALPDVDSDDLCPDPVGVDDLKIDEVEALRNAGTHVSAAQTLPAGACRYKNWHVVGARFEPCGFRARVASDDPNAFDPKVNQTFPHESCGGSELRLVLQPFIPRRDGGYGSIDMAIHAFYKLDDVHALVQDLRSLRAVTRKALDGKTGEGEHAIWYADQKDLFLPHPGLREEMNCDSQSAGDGVGPVGSEWRRVLAKHAKQSKLFKLTWVTSDNSGGNWSFGLRIVQPDDGTLVPRKVVREESFKVETFTLSQVSRGFPYTPFDMTMNNLDYFYRDGRADKELTSDTAKSAVKGLIDISNPDKTTFNLGGKHGASCASCHTRDQTERALRTRSGKTHEQLAELAGTSVWNFPIWSPILKSIEKRNDNNLRNFGYGPALSIAVSRRAVNESEALRRVVRDYFTRSQQSETSAPFLSTNSSAQLLDGPIDFKTQIAPIFEARCGYCHTEKRAPLLLVERTAQIWSQGIVANICKGVDAWQHMPPGKDLPAAEKDLIVAWAQSLNPSSEAMTCDDYRNLMP